MSWPKEALPELVAIADKGECIAVVRTLQDAVDVFRMMKERLGLTNDFMDDVGGLTLGHTDKILGPSEDKRLGYDTFALFTALTAIEFRVYIDLDAVKRMEAIWEKRERPLYPNAKVKRISKKLVERAKPLVFKAAGQVGGIVRSHLLTPKQRSDIARKGGKAKHRNARRRSRMLRKSPAPSNDDTRLARAVDAHAPRRAPSANKVPAHPC